MSELNKYEMGNYSSSSLDTRLYYPYDRLVMALELQEYELDAFNRPECLTLLNHDFYYIAKLLYVTLCEQEGYYSKLEPVLKQGLPDIEFLVTMIGYSRAAGFTTEKILTLLCYKESRQELLFSRFKSQKNKIYILEYGIMSSHPEICTWKHPYLPIGSLIPNLRGTLKMLTGLDSLEHTLTITNTLLNLEGKTRYYDVCTLKYRNGTDNAVLFNPKYRIMCSREVQHYHFFLSMLKYPDSMKLFQEWLKTLNSPIVPIIDSSVISSKGKESLSDSSVITSPILPTTTTSTTSSKGKEPIEVNKVAKRKTIPKAVREKVWRRHSNRFDGTCWVCGDIIKYELWHCAHIKPDSDGGLPSEDNLVPACSPCNSSMHDMHMYDYMSLYYPDRLKRIGWTRDSHPIVVTSLIN